MPAMPDSPAPARRRLVLAGSVVAVFALLCGFCALGAAGLGGFWWAKQPVDLILPGDPVTAIGPDPLTLPAPLVARKMGAPAPSEEPVLWTVSPPSLGSVAGDRFTPGTPGAGRLEACVEELCAGLDLNVLIADEIAIQPRKVEARLWTPTTLSATARWKGLDQALPITWSSSNEAVVTVDASGQATPVGAGTATIRAEGGGAFETMNVQVWPQPPDPCTLGGYADALGRVGERKETKACQPGSEDFCEWSATQSLTDGGRIDEGGGWEWEWTSLVISDSSPEEIWAIAQKCMNLPPEIAALPMPELLSGHQKGTRWVPVSGEDVQRAKVVFSRGSVEIALPSECYDDRAIKQDGRWWTLSVSAGC